MMIHNDRILVIVYLAALQLQNRAVFPEVAKKTAFPFYVEGVAVGRGSRISI